MYEEPPWVFPRRVQGFVPPKVLQFMWQAAEGKIVVMECLRRRGADVEGEGVCVLCGLERETVQHLLLTCVFVSGIRNRIMRRESISWCVPGSVKEMLQQWNALCVGTAKELWEVIPYAVGWTVWLARNGAIFRAEEVSLEMAWDLHITRIYWWIQAANIDCDYSLHDFQQSF
ncbi:uncharacterized protein LOC130730264 [Lotus japonicus]|uniref:uncharacterized protein LOC130730264 n=1 Tax=Lotus japonicus TaxID=34305 RepID=UPI00258FE4D8|nr:uncharacterized protein LOC130730264 [Lotus japonicus]